MDKLRNRLIHSNRKDQDEHEDSRKTGIVTASALNIRSGPSASHQAIAEPLSRNTKVSILKEQNGWYNVEVKCAAGFQKLYPYNGMSRSPSHLTGGIVWKNISGHYHIALIADHNNRKSWKLPVVKQDQYVQAASDPFEEISLITGVEVKDPVSADTVFYPDNDPPSYAIFWHLRVKANTREFTPSGNRHVKWVSSAEAVISLLALESEKRLIRSI